MFLSGNGYKNIRKENRRIFLYVMGESQIRISLGFIWMQSSFDSKEQIIGIPVSKERLYL
jgi:hypothetical protein